MRLTGSILLLATIMLSGTLETSAVHAAELAVQWNAAVPELAQRIVGRLATRGEVRLSLKNLSTLTEQQVLSIGSQLEAGLNSTGVRVAREERATDIQVVFSENNTGYVWTAVVRTESTQDVIILPVSRSASEAPASAPAAVVLEKRQLLTREQPMLDALELISGPDVPSLVVALGRDDVTLYERTPGQITERQTVPLEFSRALPRDARGRILARRDNGLDLYLSGLHCSASLQGVLRVNCEASDEPWPIGRDPQPRAFLATGRNYFDGRMVLGEGARLALPAFFAAAPLDGQPSAWLLASLEGNTVAWRSGEAETVADDWGSELAVLRDACGAEAILADHVDASGTTFLQAHRLSGDRTQPLSAPLTLPGPLSAMWPAVDGASAVVVSHNRESDLYEAYRITASCGQ